MNVNHALVPCHSYVDQWFQYAMDYDTLKGRMLSGEFNTCLPQDRAFIMEFVNKKEWIFQAIKNEDFHFFQALVEAGADVNAVNEDGWSVLALACNFGCSPNLFLLLDGKGAKYQAKEGSLLSFLLKRTCPDMYETQKRKEQANEWRRLLVMTMPQIPSEEFYAIPDVLAKHLWAYVIEMVQNDDKVHQAFGEVVCRLINENPKGVILIFRKFLKDCDNDYDFRVSLIELIAQKKVADHFIEQIVTDPEILFSNLTKSGYFENLEQCWTPSGDLLALSQTCKDFRIGIYVKAILNATTLSEAATLLLHLCHLPDVGGFDKAIIDRLRGHIVALERKERSTVWMAMAKCYEDGLSIIIGYLCDDHRSRNELLQLIKLGFDPNMPDLDHCRTFLFPRGVQFLNADNIRSIGFNPDHVDAYGNNAIEHHCRNFERSMLCIIRTLVRAGGSLTDRFPNIQHCRRAFPKDNYLQAVLGIALLYPHRAPMKRIFETMSNEDATRFHEAICNDSILNAILGKFMRLAAKKEVIRGTNVRPYDSFNQQWEKKYHPEDLKKLDSSLSGKNNDFLAILSEFWDGIVPSEIFKMIPESPLGSLILNALQMQHRQLIEKRRNEPVVLGELLGCIAFHDDMVHINRYLFANPAFMRMLVEDYMHAKAISILPGGGAKTNYGITIFPLMQKMGDLLQLPSYSHHLPVWHRTLLDAFKERIRPIPTETLQIPDCASVRLYGRTAVVTSENGCHAFKFLRQGEKYDYFAQEHSVCQAFRAIAEQFNSLIIDPVGVYAVRQLPLALHPFQQELGGLNHRFVFHYKAHPDTYVYLQDVPAEKYGEAREKTLHEAAKLIQLGIYPDLAAMFHNHQQSRRYVLLVDVMVRLIHNSTPDSMFKPAGGAGRLETPFVKTKYPNARLTGMTDLRDALLYYGEGNMVKDSIEDMRGVGFKDRGTVKYFYQMNALSSVLLIDMLILAERYMKEGSLQWTNEAMNERFGRELAEGFAYLFASYSGQEQQPSLRFALQSGIDWTRAARQIAFWLDTGDEGYPAWVDRKQVPPGLYEDHIDIEVDMTRALNFDRPNGFRTNGSQDIGVYNGPLALDQFEKAMHLLFNAIALREPLKDSQESVRFHHC